MTMRNHNGFHITVSCDPSESTRIRSHEGVPTLEDMQAHVGGWVDVYNLWESDNGRRVDAWVNDEGLLLDLPPSLVVFKDGNRQILAGPVIVTATDAEGETVGLTPNEMLRFFEHVLPEFPLPYLDPITGEPKMAFVQRMRFTSTDLTVN